MAYISECNGKDNGCGHANCGKCSIGDGNCDSDTDCVDSLSCGGRNCGLFHSNYGWPGHSGQRWDFADNCCYCDGNAVLLTEGNCTELAADTDLAKRCNPDEFDAYLVTKLNDSEFTEITRNDLAEIRAFCDPRSDESMKDVQTMVWMKSFIYGGLCVASACRVLSPNMILVLLLCVFQSFLL